MSLTLSLAPYLPTSPVSDPDIRYCVLASLDERFDAHLAQAENLQALFVALNDEVFEIRELAICTIGRLSSMNPAFVMPFLRKMLIQVTRAVDLSYLSNFTHLPDKLNENRM